MKNLILTVSLFIIPYVLLSQECQKMHYFAISDIEKIDSQNKVIYKILVTSIETYNSGWSNSSTHKANEIKEMKKQWDMHLKKFYPEFSPGNNSARRNAYFYKDKDPDTGMPLAIKIKNEFTYGVKQRHKGSPEVFIKEIKDFKFKPIYNCTGGNYSNNNTANSGYNSNTSSSNNQTTNNSIYNNNTSNSYNTTTSAQDEVIADGVMALAQGIGSLFSRNNNTYRVSESDKKERREKLRINLASWNNNEDFNALEKVLFTGFPRYRRYSEEYLPNKKYDDKFHENLLWMYLTHNSTSKFSKYTVIGLDDLGDLHINKEAIMYYKLAYRQGNCLGKKVVGKSRIKYLKNSIVRILGKKEANSWFKNIKKNDNCNNVQTDYEKFRIDNLPEEYKLSASELYEKGVSYGHTQKNDEEKALYWFKKAAKKDHPKAQEHIGHYYVYGNGGVTKNYETALYWFKKAAANGNTYAMYRIGSVYEDNFKDYDNALLWYKRGAEKNNHQSQYFLGRMYNRGIGVTKDYEKALYWYSKAADNNNHSAQEDLGRFYLYGKGVKKDLKKAFFYTEKAAKVSYFWNAQNTLGTFYENGQGTKRDLKKAIHWYTKAAEYNSYGQYNLGRLYKYGKGVSKDIKQSQDWFKKACKKGHKKACSELKSK